MTSCGIGGLFIRLWPALGLGVRLLICVYWRWLRWIPLVGIMGRSITLAIRIAWGLRIGRLPGIALLMLRPLIGRCLRITGLRICRLLRMSLRRPIALWRICWRWGSGLVALI